jgi:D-alanyl-D-alanine carboxypeptidase/D-alanyl-D-alanine-endopeptidase (penicillin-binding protein 4)
MSMMGFSQEENEDIYTDTDSEEYTDSLYDTESIALTWGEEMKMRLDGIARECDSNPYYTGLYVYDLTADSSVYEYNINKQMRPASSMKVVTAISALSLLGPNHEFRTSAYIDGSVDADGFLNGDIYVVGGFDPAFTDSDLDGLASYIQSMGISGIRGKVYGDVSYKDSLYWGSGWCWDDAPSTYEPYLSPLLFNRGCVKVSVNGRSAPTTSPRSSFIKFDDRRSGNGSATLRRNWMSNSNVVSVRGGYGGSKTTSMSVFAPERFFVCTLVDRLKEKGVVFTDSEGNPLSECYGIKTKPESVTKEIWNSVRTLSQILVRMMKDSDNLYAESVFYHIGHSSNGPWASASDASEQVESVIRRAGGNVSSCQIADGSGCSLYDYVTPKVHVQLLKYAYQNNYIYRELYRAMPIAGVDGTLASRMKSGNAYTNVHAKTGTVNGVSCLAGYVTASNGNMLAFSIMNNGSLPARKAKVLEDRICQILAK